MKILILSITAGQGHNSTAKAMMKYFEGMGIECRILDTYKYCNKLIGETVAQAYPLSLDVAPKLYSAFYRMAEKRKKALDDLNPTRLSNEMISTKLKNYISIYDPDVIICPHIYSSVMMDVIKTKHPIRAKVMGLVTDFVFHPYWEECVHLDYVITPSEMLDYQAMKKGFSRSQVLPFGIPIDPKFSVKITQADARAQLGLDPVTRTLLIMSGGTGYGRLNTLVKKIDEIDSDFQMITVCGSNRNLKKRIDSMTTKKRLLNFGYADNVEVLMAASDCVISKPGGLTTSEILAKGLPMIIVNPIPGQEDRNTEFLLNNGAAVKVSDTCPLEELLYQLFNYPVRLENMRRSAQTISKPNATRDICHFAAELGKS